MTDIAERRLHNQRLAGHPCSSPVDVVRRFTAVQSQDYGGAAWALAQRTGDATEQEIGRLFDQGVILRTHVMRPTWHFVLPEDIRWLQDLTGPRVRSGLASRHRQLEIDDATIARAEDAVTAALSGGRSLTRVELDGVFRAAGIGTQGQRLPHLLMAAEMDGLIASGPRRGAQHTYALIEERAPGAPRLPRQEALAELARRYFSSHGPAGLQDFVWWSGLPVADARTGIRLADSSLVREVVDGMEYWTGPDADPVSDARPLVHLLPNFDEYTVGYRDRTAAIDPGVPFDPSLFSFGSILSNVVTVGGRVRGAWRRTLRSDRVVVEIRLLAPLSPAHADAAARAAERMGRYLGRSVELTTREP